MSESVFGEGEYKPAPAISSWKATVDIHRGSRDALAQLKKTPRQRWTKLDINLKIARKGWKPCALSAGDFYSEGSEKLFQLDCSRPKTYFDVLLDSMTILKRLPATELQLKCIYHGLPSAYYHALLTVTDRGKLHALLAALEDAPSPTAVPAHRISEIADAVPEPEDDGAAGKPALPPMDDEAIRATHKVAWQVLHA